MLSKNSFYSPDEVSQLGFKHIGKEVYISKKASFYDVQNISIGDLVRIDDFCILSGNIKLGSYIHISAYCCLYGRNGIIMEDFTGLSPKVTVLSASDDFDGDYLIGPMIPSHYTNVSGGTVKIMKYVQVGACCVIFPKIIINEGAVVGAMSLINKDVDEWSVYAGIPANFLKLRNKKLLIKADDFLNHNILNQKL